MDWQEYNAVHGWGARAAVIPDDNSARPSSPLKGDVSGVQSQLYTPPYVSSMGSGVYSSMSAVVKNFSSIPVPKSAVLPSLSSETANSSSNHYASFSFSTQPNTANVKAVPGVLPAPNTLKPTTRNRGRGRSGWDQPPVEQQLSVVSGFIPKFQQPPPPPPPQERPPPPPPPPAASASDQNEWPQELKDYVQRAFNSVSTEKDKDRVEEALKHKLGVVFSRNLVTAIDWTKEPLPQLFTQPTPQISSGSVANPAGRGSGRARGGFSDYRGDMWSGTNTNKRRISRSRSRSPERERTRSTYRSRSRERQNARSRSRSRSSSRSRSRSKERSGSGRYFSRRRRRFSSSSSMSEEDISRRLGRRPNSGVTSSPTIRGVGQTGGRGRGRGAGRDKGLWDESSESTSFANGRGGGAVNDIISSPQVRGRGKRGRGARGVGPGQMPGGQLAFSSAKLANRASRFKDHLNGEQDEHEGNPLVKNPWSGSIMDSINQLKVNDDADIDWEIYKIEGTSKSLEKQYLRLTRAPDPSEVRPVAVLRQALQLFRHKWASAQKPEYLYINEQLKSIRQDLTVQCIRDAFTVEVYECHACIALDVGDREEFNQCASQLKVLYEEGIPGRQLELTAYRLLYYLNTNDYTQMNTTLASLSAQARQEPHVAFALRARTALALNNYYVFFRLLPLAPGHCAAALGWVLQRERRSALEVLVKAYRPNLPLSYLRHVLGLQEDDSSREITSALLKDAGLENALLIDDKLDCKLAANLLQAV